MNPCYLTVKNLYILDEAGIPLVKDISFSMAENGIFFLVGETGSGKTLITQAIAGTLAKRLTARGKVLFDGRNLLEFGDRQWKELWGKSLFLIPQEPFAALNPLLSVSRQVREIFEHIRSMDRRSAARETDRILDSLDISPSAAAERPGKLSGGMAQRVLLSTALASPADMIILDEPTKGLDSDRKEEAIRLIGKLLGSGKTVLCITHDLALPMKLGGRTGVLFSGMLVESGPSGQLFEAPSHPYTKGLLDALPERGLNPIPDDLLRQMERAWTA